MEMFEGLIDYLDQRGMIDRSRVGIQGWSRTCYHVTYALTHSTYKFAAADIADGADSGYFQYMFSSKGNLAAAKTFEQLNGALPFGDGLLVWLQQSPSFLMNKVHAPMRIEAIGTASLLFEWDWYFGLSRLGKPVDMIYIPDGSHSLVKPWERMTSQQGNVDWFCFWLKGEEDPDPAKAEQYARWRELRKLQEASATGLKPN